MLGVLSPSKIDRLLCCEAVGRLGCQDESGKMYILPINYGYDGKHLYAHSKEGLKIALMRKNPNVCFNVDRWEENGSWQSVLIWGLFEEIVAVRDQRAAMKVFTQQMARTIPRHRVMPSHGFVKGGEKNNNPFKSVVFKITIKECTGRFEDL